MTMKTRLAELARQLGFKPPIPDNVLKLTADYLANRVINSDDNACWNRYRLVEVAGTMTRPVDGKWPLITSVHYLAKGEDDEPTVYIASEDGPNGSFPVALNKYVWIIPPVVGGDVVL